MYIHKKSLVVGEHWYCVIQDKSTGKVEVSVYLLGKHSDHESKTFDV